MHADRGIVSFHRVLELIAGFDLQRLANLPWNCCLSFPGDRGMGHELLLTLHVLLAVQLCLTWPLAGKSPSAVGSFSAFCHLVPFQLFNLELFDSSLRSLCLLLRVLCVNLFLSFSRHSPLLFLGSSASHQLQ